MKLIDKDALVAEIERLKDNAHNGVSYHQSRQNVGLNNELSTWEHLESAFAIILKIINTLEVKEVDLEKEIDLEEDKYYGFNSLSRANIINIAKHFFELGIKAQIMTSKLQQRIGVLKMGFWTGLQTFEETEMTLSDAYNQGVDDILEELGLKAQKGEEL